VGTNAFSRVRIGIGRPPAESEVVDYVLTPFSIDEKEIFEESVRIGAAAALEVVSGGLVSAMNKFNSR
jgi:PTH1 family peptidyl-tRNA hydrolase